MAASLVLLVAFQGFWLKNVYDQEKQILQKRTDDIFQKTIATMQDSLFKGKLLKLLDFKKIVPKLTKIAASKKKLNPPIKAGLDSVHQKIIKITIGSGSDISLTNRAIGKVLSADSSEKNQVIFRTSGDSLISKWIVSVARRQLSKDSNGVLVFATKPNQIFKFKKNKQQEDSPKNVPSVKVSVRQSKKGKIDTLVQFPNIVITNDSLKISKIREKYADSLQKSGIALPFVVKRLPQKNKVSVTQKISTSQVYAGVPFDFGYVAEFDNYQRFLFKKIVPHCIFSLLLIGLTALAFGLVFKNLRQQKRLTALKNDFIGNVTHELKTPITTVSVALEALQNFDILNNPEKTKEYLRISQNELARLAVLVDKVLKMSVFEQQGIALESEDIDLKVLTEQIAATMRLQFEKYAAAVDFAVSGRNFTLRADRTHLTNVIYNLLDNALKYGNKAPKIDIEITENDKNISLSITDNGIGIEPAYQGKVFEKFFRVPTGDTHNVKGYGLGLSYVTSVVAQHGGQVILHSILDKGSRFTIILPKTT